MTEDQDCCCKTITVTGNRMARISTFLPSKGWSVDDCGYLVYTSRKRAAGGLKRGERAHRAVVARLTSVEGLEVHHMDFDKLNCCPGNLLLVPAAFNVRPGVGRRCPWTGRFLSTREWEAIYEKNR